MCGGRRDRPCGEAGELSVPGASVVAMPWMSSPDERPFLRPASLSPFDIVGDGVVEALSDRGAHELSISAVAKALGMTSQGLHQRLRRHRHDDTESAAAALFRMASVALGQRWFDWVRPSLMVLGSEVPAFRLPETEHERMGVAVWAAWHEVARGRALVGDPVPGELLASTCDDERQLVGEALHRAVGHPTPDHHLVALLALADGLRVELTRPGSTLTVDAAHEVMARQVAVVLDEATRPAA